jgi:hypothetical protein
MSARCDVAHYMKKEKALHKKKRKKKGELDGSKLE